MGAQLLGKLRALVSGQERKNRLVEKGHSAGAVYSHLRVGVDMDCRGGEAVGSEGFREAFHVSLGLLRIERTGPRASELGLESRGHLGNLVGREVQVAGELGEPPVLLPARGFGLVILVPPDVIVGLNLLDQHPRSAGVRSLWS